MSTLDREPRTISAKYGAQYMLNPPRLGPKSPRMATIPRGQDMTGAEKRMPVKR